MDVDPNAIAEPVADADSAQKSENEEIRKLLSKAEKAAIDVTNTNTHLVGELEKLKTENQRYRVAEEERAKEFQQMKEREQQRESEVRAMQTQKLQQRIADME